jgi:putative endonuclease
MFYTYLIQSEKDQGFYIGYTSDIERRRNEHLNGLVDSTKDRRPVRMIYFEAYENESAAREREEHLKDFGSAYVGLLKRLGLRT